VHCARGFSAHESSVRTINLTQSHKVMYHINAPLHLGGCELPSVWRATAKDNVVSFIAYDSVPRRTPGSDTRHADQSLEHICMAAWAQDDMSHDSCWSPTLERMVSSWAELGVTLHCPGDPAGIPHHCGDAKDILSVSMAGEYPRTSLARQ
jgi:hypothetical protein